MKLLYISYSRGMSMGLVDIVARIMFSIVVGGFIGYEREMRNRPAGFITHTLVCVGACVVSLIQMQMVHETILFIEANPLLASAMKADLGRVVAQVVTGVGFLGAGTIIFDKGSVKGLTTATTIWVVACIGLAIGLGYFKIASVAAIGIIFVIVVLKRIENNAKDRKFQMVLDIRYQDDNDHFIEEMVKRIQQSRIQVRDIKFLNANHRTEKICQLDLYFGVTKNREGFISKLAENEEIISITRR